MTLVPPCFFYDPTDPDSLLQGSLRLPRTDEQMVTRKQVVGDIHGIARLKNRIEETRPGRVDLNVDFANLCGTIELSTTEFNLLSMAIVHAYNSPYHRARPKYQTSTRNMDGTVHSCISRLSAAQRTACFGTSGPA